MPRPQLTSGKDPVPILQEAGWVSGPVWTGAENLAPTGIFFLNLYSTAVLYSFFTVENYLLG